MWLLYFATASAAETLTCDDVKALIQEGKSDEEIVAKVGTSVIPVEELACLQGAGLSRPVLLAISQQIQATGGTEVLPVLPASGIPSGFGPDPAAAAILSGTIGFGAGHFYSCDTAGGALFFAGSLVSLGTTVAGAGLYGKESGDRFNYDSTGAIIGVNAKETGVGLPLTIVGSALLFIVHAADTATAVTTAHKAVRNNTCRK